MSLPGIRADGLHAHTENVALLRQEWHALGMNARGMRAVGGCVEKLLGAQAMRPVGADQNPGM